MTRSPFPYDLAGIGLKNTIKGFDERRFARAVLSQQGMNFAGRNVKIDGEIGNHRTKCPGDAGYLETGRFLIQIWLVFRLHEHFGSRNRTALYSAENAIGEALWMAILYDGFDFNAPQWIDGIKKDFAGRDIRIAPDIGNIDEVEYIILGGMGFAPLGGYPNLRAVLSQWAGVNHILADDTLPAHVPIYRMSDLSLRTGMTEYVVYHTLRHHLRARDYEQQQVAGLWSELSAPMAHQRGVGILGLGELGQEVATSLAALRFRVRGWSRSRKTLIGVESFAGADEMDAFLGRSEILVNLLPLTPETTGTLNARLFATLPKGAYVIQVGRGPHVVEGDLLNALASGQVSGITMDVFEEEPLPLEHSYWKHPRITMTPHMASYTRPETGVPFLRELLDAIGRGETPATLVDRSAGY